MPKKEASNRLPPWVSQAFQIHDTLTLRTSDGQEYRTRIEGVGDVRFAVAWPTDEGQLIPVRRGEVVAFRIVKPQGIVLFKGPTVAVDHSRPPLLVFDYPQGDDIEIVQRRRSVRVSYVMRVCWRPWTDADMTQGSDKSREPEPWRAATMVDLSGTGLSLQMKGRLELGQQIELSLPFPTGDEVLIGKVVSEIAMDEDLGSEEEAERREVRYGIEFVFADVRQQDRLFARVFERQRELRKKGQLLE